MEADARQAVDPFDVVVIGGAFTGASFALLLKRRLPDCRIAIVELAERHAPRVGEATVEVSGCFIARVLGQYEHLSRHHQPKHGLRYWLSDRQDRRLDEMTEVGGHELPHLPSFQLDRPVLDEHLLAQARDAGCEVLRPAKVCDVDHGWPTSSVIVEELGKAPDPGDGATAEPGRQRSLSARWVIDASGRRAFIARRLRLLEKVENHPTAAAWGWWQGVADIDRLVDRRRGEAGSAATPRPQRLPMSRRLATNHFCGRGYWIWVIPQSDGATSLGIVYDKRHFTLPGEGPLAQRYEDFVRRHPGLAELLDEATLDKGDFGAYQHLPYRSRQYMDRGWALLGDAAAFLDPYYSPGLDHAAISIVATLDVVAGDLETCSAPEEETVKVLEQGIARHNAEFTHSYPRWLEALYLDKYELLGDAELVACAFLFDTAMYHFGVVTPIYRQPESLRNPLFGPDSPGSLIAWRLMRAFNRRLVVLARSRRRAGTYGRLNVGHHIASRSFGLGMGSVLPMLLALRLWLRMETQRLSYPLRRLFGRPGKHLDDGLGGGESHQPAPLP